MAKRFELIVFDWDGTLLDSAGAIVACIQVAAVDLGQGRYIQRIVLDKSGLNQFRLDLCFKEALDHFAPVD